MVVWTFQDCIGLPRVDDGALFAPGAVTVIAIELLTNGMGVPVENEPFGVVAGVVKSDAPSCLRLARLDVRSGGFIAIWQGGR